MRVLAAALLALGSTPAAGATLPGWAPGSLAIAGDEAIVTQVGPVTSGALTYHRTDVWRVALARKGVAGRATRPITVRTSTGPMRVGPLWGESSGAFALLAPGRRTPGPVIWCCDRETGLQDVLESDGSPSARRPLAVGIWTAEAEPSVTANGARVSLGAPGTAWVTRSERALHVVAAGPGGRAEHVLPSLAARDLVAVGGRVVAWITAAPYNAGEQLRVHPLGEATWPPASGPIAPDGASGSASLPVPVWVAPHRLGGVAHGLWTSSYDRGDVVSALVREAAGWKVALYASSGGPRVVWRGPERPRVATGRGSVVILDRGRLLVWRPAPGRVRSAGRIPGIVRSLATDGRRVAWTQWERVGGRRRTIVRWRSLV